MAYHLLIRFLVLVPKFAFMNIPFRKLPIFVRSIQPCQKAFSLFLWGKVEEYFHNARPVGEQVALQVIDGSEPLLPESTLGMGGIKSLPGQKLRMHAHAKDFFIIGTVENANHPPPGEARYAPPQKIMAPFQRGRLLEAADYAPLRIDASHHMLHNAILSRAVHRLQHHQQRMRLAGIQYFLKLLQQFDALFQLIHSLFLAVFAQLAEIAGIIAGQLESPAVRHPVRFNKFPASFDQAGRNIHHSYNDTVSSQNVETTAKTSIPLSLGDSTPPIDDKPPA